MTVGRTRALSLCGKRRGRKRGGTIIDTFQERRGGKATRTAKKVFNGTDAGKEGEKRREPKRLRCIGERNFYVRNIKGFKTVP